MNSMLLKQKLAELKALEQLQLNEAKAKEAQIQAGLRDSRYRASARPEQLPPDGDWFAWVILSGRGWGKTFTGAGWLIEKALSEANIECAVVAPTYTDVRRTCVEGPSGILKSLPAGALKFFNRANGQINLTNGSKIHMISADEPDRARGLNLSYAWLDEFAAWRYDETWTEGLIPALRIGQKPQVVITTTPRPTKLIREFINRTDGSTVITRGSTFDNAANLSPAALRELRARYEGTRIGRQELYGEVLDDIAGALFTQDLIDKTRLNSAPELTRVVVAVDPAVTSGEDSDLTGIVVVGKDALGRAYVLADRSCRDTPSGWAQRVINTYQEFGADRVVAEKNQGGDFIEATLRAIDRNVPYTGITARVGKKLRAEPVSALYEQGRVSHVGSFEELETEMTSWVPDLGMKSPDRLDALVHAIVELGLTYGSDADRFFDSLAPACPKCGMPVAYDAGSCRNCGMNINGLPGNSPAGFAEVRPLADTAPTIINEASIGFPSL